jgi:hypothetical protein
VRDEKRKGLYDAEQLGEINEYQFPPARLKSRIFKYIFEGEKYYNTENMDDVIVLLNERKEAFLDDIESDVRIYIKSTGKQCIAIVEKNSSSGVILKTWEVHLNDDLSDFCKVLYKFVRKEQYHGNDLDSALTEPIANMVETAYQEFYKSESEAISRGMLVMLAADELNLCSFIDRIADIALHQFSKQVRKQVVHMLIHQIEENVNQGTLHSVGQHVGHLAVATAGTQVTTIVAHLLLKLLAANIAHLVAKLLGSALLKKVLAVLIKKFVLAAVTTTVVQFLATHVGAAVGGSTIMFIVMPLLIAYIGYQISTFPEMLSKKVSKKIREELESKFESTNKTILEEIFHTVFGGNELVQAIANDEEFRNMLRNLGEEIQASDSGLSGTVSQEILPTSGINISSSQSQQTASTSDASSEIDPPPAYTPIASLSSISTQPINPTHSPPLPSTTVNSISSLQQFSSLSISSQLNPSLEGTSTPAPNRESYRLVRAKFTFPTQSPDELGLHTNDIVHVVDDGLSDDGWLKARWLHDEGKAGYVPKSFVEEF